MVRNIPCMVASLVRRHSSHPRPCHFAHTRDNLCSSLRATEWFECTMHNSCLVLSFPRVCGGCHTPTVCPAVLFPRQSSLSVSLFHHHHPSSPLVCVKRVCVGKGKEDEQTCVIQKSVWKRRRKKRNRRPHVVSTPFHQPWSQPRPHPSLRSSHHKSCFLLLWPSLFLCCSFLAFRQEVNGLSDVKQAHKSGTPFSCVNPLSPTTSFFLSLHLTLFLWCCDECACPIHATNETK